MELSVSKTSFTRCAATSARGSMMAIMPIIKNDITITMAYVMNAIMSPVWMVPASMYEPPTHTISTDTAFITSIMAGIMNVMVRLVNSCVRYSAVLALSKRCSSYC